MFFKKQKSSITILTALTLAISLSACSSGSDEAPKNEEVVTSESETGDNPENENQDPQSLAISGDGFKKITQDSIHLPKMYENATQGWILQKDLYPFSENLIFVNNSAVSIDNVTNPEKMTLRVINIDSGEIILKEEIDHFSEAGNERLFSTSSGGKQWVHLLQAGKKGGESSSLEKALPVISVSSIEIPSNTDGVQLKIENDSMSFKALDYFGISDPEIKFGAFVTVSENSEEETYSVDGPKIVNLKSGVKKDDKKVSAGELLAVTKGEALFSFYSKEEGTPSSTQTASGWKLSSLGVPDSSLKEWTEDGYLLMDDGSLIDLDNRKLVTKFKEDIEGLDHSLSPNGKFITVGSFIYDVEADKVTSYKETADRKGVRFSAISNDGVAYGNVEDDNLEPIVMVDSRSDEVQINDDAEYGSVIRGVSESGTLIYFNSGTIIGVNSPSQGETPQSENQTENAEPEKQEQE